MTDESPGVDGAERVADDVASQWERGGAMSDPARYVAMDSRLGVDDRGPAPTSIQPGLAAARGGAPADEHPDPPLEEGSPRSRQRGTQLALVVVGALVVAAVVASIVSSGSDDEGSTSSSTGSAAGGGGADGQAFAGRDVSAASVGLIVWERIDGDPSGLPGRIVRGSDSMLVGYDDGVARWVSSEGRQWLASPDAGVRDVGGERWVVRLVAGRRKLMLMTAGREQPAQFAAPLGASSDGFAVNYEVPDDAVDGLPVEVDGSVFVRLDRRVEIPWRTMLGIDADTAYSVEVTVGDDTSTFTSPGTTPLVASTLAAVQHAETSRVDLIGADGTVAWEFDTGGLEPAAALRGSVTPSWLRWDGRQFSEVAVPWSTVERVGLFGIADGVLAVPTIDVDNDAENAVWRSIDGTQWKSIPLPVERSTRSPTPVHSDAGAVIVTISSGQRTSNWATTDGETFHELPDIPGIERRSLGTFGWITPDPRSSPRIRVSPDGERWESIDLSEQLGIDRSQWNLTIDATAIGSTIYVTATHNESRTLLIGHVTTTPAP